jgi:predicted amidohydrolase
MSRLRVASAQFDLRPEKSVTDFIAHIEAIVRDATHQGAELLVLPELASTGLLASIDDHDVTSAQIKSDYWNVLPTFTDDIRNALSRLAGEHDITIAGGSHIRLADDGSLRNTAFLAHPDGRVEQQDKIHLTPPEHELGIQAGDELLLTQVGPFTVGILICADVQFPELSRNLVDRGMDLLLVPSLTWNRRGVHRVRTGCEARAIENQMYVVMSPLIGSDGLPSDAPMHAVGNALVTTPVDKNVGLNDGLLGIAEGTDETLLVVELDRAILERSRAVPETPGLELRLPALYDRLRTNAGTRS